MISMIALNIFLWIAGIIGFAGIIGILPFSAMGIIMLAKISNENDAAKKSSLKKKGIIFLVLPWALALIGLIILMVLIVIRSLLNM